MPLYPIQSKVPVSKHMALLTAAATVHHVHFSSRLRRKCNCVKADEGNIMAKIKCRYGAGGGIIESGMRKVRCFPPLI